VAVRHPPELRRHEVAEGALADLGVGVFLGEVEEELREAHLAQELGDGPLLAVLALDEERVVGDGRVDHVVVSEHKVEHLLAHIGRDVGLELAALGLGHVELGVLLGDLALDGGLAH